MSKQEERSKDTLDQPIERTGAGRGSPPFSPPDPEEMVRLYEQMLDFSQKAMRSGISPAPLLMQVSLGVRRQALLFHLMGSSHGASTAETAETLRAYSSDVRLALEGLRADGLIREQGRDAHGRPRYVFAWDRGTGEKEQESPKTTSEEGSP